MSLKNLEALVVKDNVHLGGLNLEARAMVLALVWAETPDTAMTEKQANQVLQERLATTVCFLQTDHVELRRWLVDLGWLQRDGFGHVYQRVPPQHLRPGCTAATTCLPKAPLADWVQGLRTAYVQRREAKHQDWLRLQPQGLGPTAPTTP
jgi:Uncharacterized protein conserved in bacteria (DUF2087)